MNRNFVEMLCALSDAGAEYLIVGGHAFAAYHQPRATKDLDIWVRPSRENAVRVRQAIEHFGMPVEKIPVEDLAEPGLVLQFGYAPQRIDVITSISGVEFDEAWPRRIMIDIEGRPHPVIGKDDFIRNKRAVGRPQDIADVDVLTKKR